MSRLARVATVSVHTSPLDQPGTGDAGGMNVYIVEVAKRMAERGIEVDLFTRATSRTRPPTAELVPYDTAYLSGHVVEQYQVVLVDAAQAGLERMHEQVRQMCIAAIPGDTYQNLRFSPQWSGRTFKHVLVPVYVMTYVYGRTPYQVVVNASNGRMGGTYPVSWVKVALIILAVLIVLMIVNR